MVGVGPSKTVFQWERDLNWKIPEDLPVNPPEKLSHSIIHNDKSADIVEKCIDDLIPRGGKKPNQIAVSLEDYLSWVAMFNRKIKGVRHRKSCWDRITDEHLVKFEKMDHKSPKKDIKGVIPKKGKMTYTFSLRDIRLENEFEVLIYSVRSSLTMLTRLISAFLKSKTDLHSHSNLQKSLNTAKNWPALSAIVNEACHDWIDDLTKRRDAATHYVALTATSSLTIESERSNVIKVQRNTVSIPKQPLKFVSVWWDDIPVLGWASHSSTAVTNDDGNIIEAHGLFDGTGNLLVRRNTSLPELPELIDGREYCDNLMRNYENYFVKVASELKTKIC